jgi:DNA topoisomerase-1
MPKNLIIVESPAKAKTLSRYLGADYVVLASVGHVRDLPARTLGVAVENGFAPTYPVLPAQVPVVREIGEAAKSSEHIYLATDPDREGEAIAWHVARAAGLDEARTARIAFHQVTQAAVREAIAHPRPIDEHLVDAQQARRVLDRLVGYQISPLLSKTMHRRLSAGRVQSVALRLVVEREREIMAFVPVEYWSLEADLQRHSAARERFRARLIKISGQDPDLPSRAQVDAVLQALEGATYTVTQVRPGQRRRNPSPPFITSTLQAAASSRLRYSPRQTMALAQQLYEGIDLTGERVGLITYMRTDSTHVAPEAQPKRGLTWPNAGAGLSAAKPPVYTRKVLSAGGARGHSPHLGAAHARGHEAFLTEQQARLYELIWRRFVASQRPRPYTTLWPWT